MAKESQVLWEDPKEVEERMKLLEQMNAKEKNLPPLLEISQDMSLPENETISSFDSFDNLSANLG